MKINDFLQTENGRRYANSLKGCNKYRDCEYWESEEEYYNTLKANGWTEDNIQEELDLVRRDCYKAAASDLDFVVVIN